MSYSYVGQADPMDLTSFGNVMDFFVRRILATIPGSMLVQVVEVSNTAGAVAPIGTVNVRPLVNQTNLSGAPTPHGTVYGLPYCRVQGGSSALILDPQVNDIGIAVICSRDHSSVLANSPEGNTGNAQANPGSGRQNAWSDGIYILTVRAAAPSEYIAFTGSGINIVSSSLTHNGKDIGSTHEHGGVSKGSQDTGPPL